MRNYTTMKNKAILQIALSIVMMFVGFYFLIPFMDSVTTYAKNHDTTTQIAGALFNVCLFMFLCVVTIIVFLEGLRKHHLAVTKQDSHS